MDIGIGLPGHAPGADGRNFVEWARRAEARGFSTLAATDRLAWTTPEPLITLAAAAGATSRIRLLTTVLMAPLRTNHALFAKSVNTLDQVAGPGRLRLGLAPGILEDDFTESNLDFGSRGKPFDRLLERLVAGRTSEDPVGPPPATEGGPPLLFGGYSKPSLRRIRAHGSGWIAGTAKAEEVQAFMPNVRQAWDDAGRTGSLRIVALAMYALGPNAEQAISDGIRPYYAFGGDEYTNYSVSIASTTAEQIKAAVTDFEGIGVDELIFIGNDPDPGQVDLLAAALGH